MEDKSLIESIEMPDEDLMKLVYFLVLQKFFVQKLDVVTAVQILTI